VVLGGSPYHFVDHLGQDRDQNEIGRHLHGSLHLHFLFPDDWMARGNDVEEKVLQTRRKFAVLLTSQDG
jgi:hypothetical protein